MGADLVVYLELFNIWRAAAAVLAAAVGGFYRGRAAGSDFIGPMVEASRPAAELERMTKAIQRLEPRPAASIVASMMAWFLVVMFGIAIVHLDYTVPELRYVIYGAGRPHSLHSRDDNDLFYVIWLTTLLLAYSCHWLVVREHLFAVKSLFHAAKHSAGPPTTGVRRYKIENGLSALWVIGAILSCLHAAWWGIPLALAGAMQRKYMTTTSRMLRGILAEGVRTAASPQDMEAAKQGIRFCRTQTCGCHLPQIARYCPRCGTPTGPA